MPVIFINESLRREIEGSSDFCSELSGSAIEHKAIENEKYEKMPTQKKPIFEWAAKSAIMSL